MIRLEIYVRKEDAALVRNIARALGDPQAATEARRILRARFSGPPEMDLKELLASAPLEGVDLERSHDAGRVA